MRRAVAMLAAIAGLALTTGCDQDPQSATDASAGSAGPAKKVVLGPDGLGELKLGMPMDRAVQTGLLAGEAGDDGLEGCNTDFTPKAAGDAEAPVFFDGERGLVSLTAFPGAATPETVELGSSSAAVRKAYPDFGIITGPGEDGRGWAQVPGNDKAVYNITIVDGKVAHLNLQSRDQGCYE